MTRRLSVALCAVLLATAAHAQRTQSQIDSAFAPLGLPTPNPYRSADGRPGPAYWQNRADYLIAARLDEATHAVTGTVRVRYTNNAPEPLPYVWMQLEQNLFAPTSRGARRTPPDSRWRGSFPGGGYRLGEVTAQDQAVVPLVSDTRMRLDLPRPLASGATAEITVPYSFTVPEYGADRMGRLETAQGTVYEIAQWFPRMAVYDDVSGWNTLPYLGQGEFYLDYGDVEYEITVPAAMTVVGTGTLLNEDEVYTAQQRERLAQARRSTSRVYGRRARRGRRLGEWHQDVALPRRERPRRGVGRVARVHPRRGKRERPAGRRQHERRAHHERLPRRGRRHGREPGLGGGDALRARLDPQQLAAGTPTRTPVAISVAGVVGGMEYPMLHFSGVEARGQSLFGVVDHELGHNWFPMIVGSDERRYAWMDEGFNTFLNTFSNTAFYDHNEDPGHRLCRGWATRRASDASRRAAPRPPFCASRTARTSPS